MNIFNRISSSIEQALDRFSDSLANPYRIQLTDSARLSIQSMEAQGYVSFEDYLQLITQHPEAHVVAERILNVPRDAVFTHIKNNAIPAGAFAQKMTDGLINFYGN